MEVGVRRVMGALRRFLPGRKGVWRAAAVGGVGLAAVLIFGALAVVDHLSERRAARQHMLGTVTALAEHAGAVFTAVDLALMQVERAIGEGPVANARADRRLQLELQSILGRMPALESLFLVDEAGIISASSRSFPMPPYDVQHRDYFQIARSGEDTLYFSVPFRGEFSRSVAFTVSRRIVAPDGTFRGVVAATLFPEYFHSLYRGAYLAAGRTTVAFVRTDGTQILRFPDTRANEAPLVTPEFAVSALRQQSGFVSGTGLLDATTDIAAFRVVPNAPLVLIYGARHTDLISPWYGRLASYGGLTFVLACLVALSAAYMLFARREAPQSAPADSGPMPHRPSEHQNRGAVQVLDAVRSSLGLLRGETDEKGATSPFGPRPRDILEGAGHGLTLAQRLLAGVGRAKPETRIVNVRASLLSLSHLLVGSFWPTLEVERQEIDEGLDVFVDPAGFDLALFELAVALKQCLPAGAPLRVSAARRALRLSHPEGLPPGDYVVIAFDSEEAVASGGGSDQQTRLRFVARFAHRHEGALIVPPGEVVGSAALWLPNALIVRETKS